MKILKTLLNITGQYRGSAHRDCNINVKVYDSHLIMQEVGKFILK